MSNMWDLESIQLKNARQISSKVPLTKKSLMSLTSIGRIGHEISSRWSLSEDMPNDDSGRNDNAYVEYE